jgi:PAS domain S-box-containing protein
VERTVARLSLVALCCFGIILARTSSSASPVGCYSFPNPSWRVATICTDRNKPIVASAAWSAVISDNSFSQRDRLKPQIAGAVLVTAAALFIFFVRHNKNKLTAHKKYDYPKMTGESETYSLLLEDEVPVLMWVSRPDKVRSHFNKEWLRFTGRTEQQELNGGWIQNIHPADSEGYLRKYNRAFDAHEKFAIEYRLRHHTGDYRWVLEQGVPSFMRDGSFAGYVGCCLDVTQQKTAERVQAELSGRLIRAQEDERARIARELHDDINQRLALLANGIQDLEQTADSSNFFDEKEKAHALWRLTGEISADIQDLSHQLHPSKMHYLGLAAAMRGLCLEFSRFNKIEMECIVNNVPPNLDENVELNLFRTAQEALRNIARHSHAQHAKVELIGDDQELRLRISDDGIGFRYDETKGAQGLGLVSMEERLKLVGGRFSLWSETSGGTLVEGVVPVSTKLPKAS